MRSPRHHFDLRAALSQELRAAVQDLDAAAARPKAIHRCRLRLKRARALARVGRACAPGLAAVFNQSARAVMHTLAQERELSALAESARRIAKRSGGRGAEGLNAVAENLERARLELAPIDFEAARAALKDLLALAQVWPEASHRQVRKGALRVAGRARKAYQRGVSASACERRHEWRKREKDRFYASTLLDDAWPAARRRKRAERLGDVLGRERDALLLTERLKTAPSAAGGSRPAKRALKALRVERARLAERARRLGRAVHAGGA